MPEADPGSAGARRRIGGWLVGGLVVVWVLLGAALLSILSLEALTMEEDCLVPDLVRTYGETSWQAWPPGEVCTFESVVVGEPAAVRGWAIVIELVLGVVLVVLWRRSERAPDPDWSA